MRKRPWLHGIQSFANLMGVTVRRYPAGDDLFRVVTLMQTVGVTVLLDIGANDGGHARAVRRLGYGGRIASFEPTSSAWQRLDRAAVSDPMWDIFPWAVGDADQDVKIGVAGNAGHSSSVLPMLETHALAAPDSKYVSSENVQMVRLDSVWDAVVAEADIPFIKIDVQGAEGLVLDGASTSLDRVVGVQTELSLAALYDGQTDYQEVLDRLTSRGFALAGVIPGFSDPRTGRMLQFDGIFIRD